MAYWVFLAFYVLCAVITWFAYVRRPSKVRAAKPATIEEASLEAGAAA
jgi:NNP family nitrate/nitrite transporter-like MFS transporter